MDLFGKPDGKLDAFSIASGSVVVDYGCGPGRYIRKASRQAGPRGLVYAADIHPMAIDIVRKKIQKFGLENVRPVHLASAPTGIPDRCADFVYALDMFDQIEDPVAFLDETPFRRRSAGAFPGAGRRLWRNNTTSRCYRW